MGKIRKHFEKFKKRKKLEKNKILYDLILR